MKIMSGGFGVFMATKKILNAFKLMSAFWVRCRLG